MKTRIFVSVLVIFVFGISTKYGISDDFDWPRWRGPNGDGISLETDWNPEALVGGSKILWKVNIGMGHSNVVIKDNRLYTLGMRKGDLHVYCLNAETGDEIWRHLIDDYYDPQSTPAIDNKYVYALSRNGILVCLKAKNGKIRWKKDIMEEFFTEKLHYGYAQSPVVDGDLLLLNINTAGIAVNKKTGDPIWVSDVHTVRLMEGYYATPILYDYEGKRSALMFSGTGLFSVDVQTGNTMWFYEWYDNVFEGATNQTNAADPIVFENGVFISSSYGIKSGALLEISGNEPKVIWQNENMKNYFSTSVLVDGYLYGIDGTNKKTTLRCIDWETGHLMWEKKMKMATLIAADGKLIILEEDGTLHIAEATPSSYREISSGDVLGGERKYEKFWTPPVLYRGKIYVRDWSRLLICVDVSM